MQPTECAQLKARDEWMIIDLTGKRAIVIGSTAGIGFATEANANAGPSICPAP
jgi:hypothetical protein